jgi:hypothetical protein
MALVAGGLARQRARRRRWLIEAGSAIVGLVLLIWSLIPVYNMFLIALDPDEGEIEFSGHIYPPRRRSMPSGWS